MKLAISNIAWQAADDLQMYNYLRQVDFNGIEIAPTRIWPEHPYELYQEAAKYAIWLKEQFALSICSLQSIWYGRSELLFGTKEERDLLLDYTKKAILFAESTECSNLVFGCPRNRNYVGKLDWEIVVEFFSQIGDYAHQHNTCVSMEANPTIYNTNFINTTKQAFEIVQKVGSQGFKVNVDMGTILYNKEDLSVLETNMKYVNHIHISEPGLNTIVPREEHQQLKTILDRTGYESFVSIEMKKQDTIENIKEVVKYIRKTFG